MKYIDIAKTLRLEEYFPLGQVLFDNFNEVILVEEKKEINFSFKEKERIQKEWQEHLLENPNDFDGNVGSVMEIIENDKILKIIFRRGKFSQFYSTQKKRKEKINLFDVPLDKGACLPISFGAVTTTKSSSENPHGCIIFAKRGKTAFDSEVITLLPGGYFDPEKDFSLFQSVDSYSILSTVSREFFEETGIVMDSIKVDYLGIVYNSLGSRQPLIACHLDIPFSKEELKIRTDEESKEIFFINNDINSVKEFIKDKEMAVHDAWKLILYFNKILNN